MQLFLRFGTTYLTYSTFDENDIVLDIKRFVGKRENLSIESYLDIRVQGASNYQKITDVFTKEQHVELYYPLLGGPSYSHTEKFCIALDVPLYPNNKIHVKYHPSTRIYDIIVYLLEELYAMSPHKLTPTDVILKYKEMILDPYSMLAQYKEIARSYINFCTQQKVFNDNTIQGFLLNKCSDYYHSILVGKRFDSNPMLKLCFKNKKTNTEPEKILIDQKCIECKEYGYLLTPCCRQFYCDNCYKPIIETNKCPNCDFNIDTFLH